LRATFLISICIRIWVSLLPIDPLMLIYFFTQRYHLMYSSPGFESNSLMVFPTRNDRVFRKQCQSWAFHPTSQPSRSSPFDVFPGERHLPPRSDSFNWWPHPFPQYYNLHPITYTPSHSFWRMPWTTPVPNACLLSMSILLHSSGFANSFSSNHDIELVPAHNLDHMRKYIIRPFFRKPHPRCMFLIAWNNSSTTPPPSRRPHRVITTPPPHRHNDVYFPISYRCRPKV